jgi:flagellar hook-associated protein 3 FlgL
MRVSDVMIREWILRNMNSARHKLQIAQTQIASGKRVLKPSDDPIAVSKSMNVRALLRDNVQFQRNIDDALGWIESTELAANGLSEIITELMEIAIDGATDTKSANERANLAEQVDTLLHRLVDLANTRCGDRYIFAGTYTLEAPYSVSHSVTDEPFSFPDDQWVELDNPRMVQGSVVVTDGGSTTFVEGIDYEVDYGAGRVRRLATGSMNIGVGYNVSYDTETASAVHLMVPATDGKINREIAGGVYENVNVGGEDILNSRVDIISLMIDLKESLFRNDGAAVNQALNDIDTAIDQTSSSLGTIGATQRAFQLAQARLDTENTNLKAIISSLEDAELADVIVRFQAEQMAYESALAASATVLNTSLLNFLT